MTEVKFTPGPWRVDEVRTQSGRAFRIGSGEMLVAGKGCCIIYDDYPGNPDNGRKANARLIAAAPDMLDALKATLSDFVAWSAIRGGIGTYGHAMDRIASAIAKAEGPNA